MAGKPGREKTLIQRTNISVNIEQYQKEYLASQGLEMSKFVRDCLENFIKNNETPREVLKREKEELEVKLEETKEQINMIDLQLKKLDENEQKVVIEELEIEEFETKREEYVKGCTSTMKGATTYNSLWLQHLRDVWKFKNNEEAINYVCTKWIASGVAEYKVKKFLRLT